MAWRNLQCIHLMSVKSDLNSRSKFLRRLSFNERDCPKSRHRTTAMNSNANKNAFRYFVTHLTTNVIIYSIPRVQTHAAHKGTALWDASHSVWGR